MLIIGCGDIGLRMAQHANPERDFYGVVRSEQSLQKLNNAAIHPLQIDMDAHYLFPDIPPQAQWVYLAPPAPRSRQDSRLRQWLMNTPKAQRPARFIYISTSGVYGDHQGAWVDESTPVNPQTERAQRRVDAEQQLQQWCATNSIELLILRVPGIIGVGRSSLDKLRAGQPLIHRDEAPYTNLVDADFLAKAILFLASKAEAGIYNVSDREPVSVTQKNLDLCAEHNIPVPPFISLAEAEKLYSPMRMSYLNESRRMNTDKLKAIFKA